VIRFTSYGVIAEKPRVGKLGQILQSVNNRTQSLREIAYYAWLLLTPFSVDWH